MSHIGSVYTQDLNRALRVSRAIRGGTINVNCAAIVGPQVPMGGFKLSGVGREMGEYALRHYTEPKSIWIKYVHIPGALTYQLLTTVIVQPSGLPW
jgi:acyl-CoA reductase-like NAD-dependent aldehyde dehydrogenase